MPAFAKSTIEKWSFSILPGWDDRRDAGNKRNNKCKFIQRGIMRDSGASLKDAHVGCTRFSSAYFYGNRRGHSRRYFLRSLRKYLAIRYVVYVWKLQVSSIIRCAFRYLRRAAAFAFMETISITSNSASRIETVRFVARKGNSQWC